MIYGEPDLCANTGANTSRTPPFYTKLARAYFTLNIGYRL
jgi:hypothetical protein